MAAGGAQPNPSGEPQRPGSRAAPLTVTQLVRGTTRVLERTIGTIYVAGEVSSLKRAASGHLYFSLSDGRSSVPCVMWRSDAARLKFRVEPGVMLLCRGRLGVYERDGKFQLYVSAAEPAGLGADALALEQLRKKLAAEGLFDVARKRPLPRLPRRIGVVTSKSGAALRDIVRAVQRRFPVPILVADCRVQGADAPRTIARAIRAICATDVDVVIVGRGGGSVGDLSAFNDERVVPVYDELLEQLAIWERRLAREVSHQLRGARQELDQLTAVATRCADQAIGRRRRALAELAHALEGVHPRARLASMGAELRALAERCDAAMQRRAADSRRELGDLARRLDATVARRVDASRQELGALARHLQAMSPLAVLDRGYALATAGDAVVRRARDVAVGDRLHLRLSEGELDCDVVARSDER